MLYEPQRFISGSLFTSLKAVTYQIKTVIFQFLHLIFFNCFSFCNGRFNIIPSWFISCQTLVWWIYITVVYNYAAPVTFLYMSFVNKILLYCFVLFIIYARVFSWPKMNGLGKELAGTGMFSPPYFGLFHNWDFWSPLPPDHLEKIKKKYPNLLKPNHTLGCVH